MTDNGGDVPGSLPNCASSIFEDGLQIPPTKLVSAGKMNDSVTEILLRNCRMPEWNRWYVATNSSNETDLKKSKRCDGTYSRLQHW